ncbi:hypothetical protein N0V83_002229 [Neocucurbitaria cava]|uniref:Uncharacterized protein n=1 Tax=Neocucurbitaria cava TaxID=798079 RepID=A0A9W8YDP9_9PLEO|nr:hypothetical protein N0V83_002229 [Neocucurbitaria cava]
MLIPDLSLNSTFSIPDFQKQEGEAVKSLPSPAMCKYTIYSYDCGHPAEDNVDSQNCSEFQHTGVHCDRDNPANKARIKIKHKNRNGICEQCLYQAGRSSKADADARQSDIEKVRELSLAETRAQEEEVQQRAEQKAREASRAEADRREAEHEAQIKEIERQSAMEFERQMRQREEDDFAFMMRQSREEADRLAHQREMEMVERAFRESLKVDPSIRNYNDEVQVEKPATKPIDYSLPAIGSQNIGRFKVGTRHMPIHPSQEIKEPAPGPSPSMTTSPLSPVARLGGTIAPTLPSMREARGPGIQIPSAQDARAGLRSTGGLVRRLTSTSQDEPNVIDPKLKAVMEKRRQWEKEADDTASNASSGLITPSQSSSNVRTRRSTPAGSAVGRGARIADEEVAAAALRVTGAAEYAWDDEEDAKSMRAKRISKFYFDKNRKGGWEGE